MPSRWKRRSASSSGGVAGREAAVHALGRDHHALRGSAEERAELVARVPRGHQHARRSPHRRPHARVEHGTVAEREPLGVPQEGDVVHGDHSGRGPGERRRVGAVDDVGAVLARRRREVERQAGDVRAAWQHHGLVGAHVHVRAGDGDELAQAQLLEAREQPADVGLVAGLAGAEHVTVDQDARGHGAGWSARGPARRHRRPAPAHRRGPRARAPPPVRRRLPTPRRRRGRRLAPRRAPGSGPRPRTAARPAPGAGAAPGRRAVRRCAARPAAGPADPRRTPRRPAAAGP